jgi:hypothetical protein
MKRKLLDNESLSGWEGGLAPAHLELTQMFKVGSFLTSKREERGQAPFPTLEATQLSRSCRG